MDDTRETIDESAVLLALLLGAVGGVLLAAGKLHWRRGLIAALVLTVLLTALAAINGKAWPLYMLALPFCMSITAAIFGALWQAKAVFYFVLGLIAYSVGLGLVDHYLTQVSFINWLAWPMAGLVVLGLYLILFMVMKAAWKNSPLGFCVQSVMVLGVYGAAGYLLELGLEGWLFALPISSFAALFIYGQGTGDRAPVPVPAIAQAPAPVRAQAPVVGFPVAAAPAAAVGPRGAGEARRLFRAPLPSHATPSRRGLMPRAAHTGSPCACTAAHAVACTSGGWFACPSRASAAQMPSSIAWNTPCPDAPGRPPPT